jgi:hypothetical protein
VLPLLAFVASPTSPKGFSFSGIVANIGIEFDEVPIPRGFRSWPALNWVWLHGADAG